MSASVLARLSTERRQQQRRGGEEPPLVASNSVFCREERGVLRCLERRRELRRRQDLTHQLSRLQELGAES